SNASAVDLINLTAASGTGTITVLGVPTATVTVAGLDAATLAASLNAALNTALGTSSVTYAHVTNPSSGIFLATLDGDALADVRIPAVTTSITGATTTDIADGTGSASTLLQYSGTQTTTLSVAGSAATSALAFSSTTAAADVLANLATIGGLVTSGAGQNVTVLGQTGGPFLIQFIGTLANSNLPVTTAGGTFTNTATTVSGNATQTIAFGALSNGAIYNIAFGGYTTARQTYSTATPETAAALQ